MFFLLSRNTVIVYTDRESRRVDCEAINRRMSYFCEPAPVPFGLSVAIHFKHGFAQLLLFRLFSSSFYSYSRFDPSSRSFDCLPCCVVGPARSVLRFQILASPQNTTTREPTYFGDLHHSGSRLGQRPLPVFPLSALFGSPSSPVQDFSKALLSSNSLFSLDYP